jgi:AN1-type zinc finger protein 2
LLHAFQALQSFALVSPRFVSENCFIVRQLKLNYASLRYIPIIPPSSSPCPRNFRFYPSKKDKKMELPHLGDKCFQQECRVLNDYLLLKCVYCKHSFCNDHSRATNDGKEGHLCGKLPLDKIATVCPICKQILTVKPTESPDLVTNEHINSGCRKPVVEKVFTNQCTFKGCKKKEIVPIKCSICLRAFCIKHRLELDHSCKGAPLTGLEKFLAGGGSSSSSLSKTPSGKSKRKKNNDCIIS